MEYIILISKNIQQILILILLLLFIYYFINIGNKFVDINKKFTITKFNIIIGCLAILLIIAIYNIVNSDNMLKEMIVLIFYSLMFSYILNPIVNYLEKKNVKRTYGILIVYLIIISIFVVILFSLIPEIIREFGNLMKLIPDYTNNVYKPFNKFCLRYTKQMEDLPPLFKNINNIFFENLNRIELYLLKCLQNNTRSMVNSMASSVKFSIVPIISFYFLKDKELFKKKLSLMIPIKYKADIIEILKKIDLSLLNFLKGQIITSIIVGILSIVALSIIDLEFAVVIGVIIAIFEIIPYLGPIVGIVLTIIFGLLDSPSKAIWGVLLILIVQQLENGIIAPKIMGESVGISPVIIIISVIIGAGYFGLIGMILAVPTISVIKILGLFFINKILEE